MTPAPRRLGYDRRVTVLALLTGAPGTLVALGFLWLADGAESLRWPLSVVLVLLWVVSALALRERVVHPLQTLANMLAALREGDFSIRARVRDGDADDALSLAYREVNALEAILREQRLGAVEASETLRKVLESVDVALFAFDDQGTVRLVNRAGERLLGRPGDRIRGRTAAELRLDGALEGVAPRTLELSFPGGQGRWELRRSVVRQEGMPLQLVVLSDLSRALREEERQAWKRIIRVLSHEINNSLTPIRSISESLQGLLRREPRPDDLEEDVSRGLGVIRTRSEALGRFMAAYAHLARLPEPDRVPVELAGPVERAASLEVRLPVVVEGGPWIVLPADPDQLEQLLINLIRNAADACLEAGSHDPVRVRWEMGTVNGRDAVRLHVLDRGPGIPETGNLFVPFYTTKPGGSGIGLALSRQIAEGHGGSLTLEDREDGPGARATLTLPLGG